MLVMGDELINSNHSSDQKAILLDACWRAGDILVAAGVKEYVILVDENVREFGRDVNELRRFRALADERFLSAPQGQVDKNPPKLWDVAMMAKQFGLSADTVRRRARGWSFTRCVAHPKCNGGTRGCDIRFIAAEAAEWLNGKRAKR